MKMVRQLLIHPSNLQLLVGVGTSSLRTLYDASCALKIKRLCVAASHIAPPQNPLPSRKQKKEKNPNSKEKGSPPSKAAAHLSLSSRLLVSGSEPTTQKINHMLSLYRILTAPPDSDLCHLYILFAQFSFLLRTTDNEEPARDTQQKRSKSACRVIDE